MKTGIVVIFQLCLLSLPLRGGENLLAERDFGIVKGWGAIPNKPENTGTVTLANRVLTLKRNRTGGDFKLYLGLNSLAKKEPYRFLCKTRKVGAGVGSMRVISFKQEGIDILQEREIGVSNVWGNAELNFTVPENSTMICFQFFPPEEIDGSVSLAQFTLLAGNDQRPPEEILQPVETMAKQYKPLKESEAVGAAVVYEEKNLLMNGDLSRESFSIPLPLHWKHGYGQDKPELRELYLLKDGVLQLKTPMQIIQEVDIAQEAATSYTLVIRARVLAGSLSCSVNLRDLRDQKDSNVISKNCPAAEGWQELQLEFTLPVDAAPGKFIISLYAKEEGGCAEVDEVKLLPVAPAVRAEAKNVCIEDAENMYPATGIYLAPDASYYESRAAKYLQKSLYSAGGKYLDIMMLENGQATPVPGMIRIGNAFLSAEEKASLREGGYAARSEGGSVAIGGSDDGAIHGAFMLLKSLGIEYFTPYQHTLPTDETLCVPEFSVTKNPAIGYRFASGARRTSFEMLGYSDYRLWADSYNRLGRWMSTEHTAPFLVDPHKYFKTHPEYYALDKNGKRSWPARGLIDFHLCLSNPEVQKIATETLLNWMDAEPWAKIFFVSCGDGHGWCQCDYCKSWDTAGSDPADGQMTDRNLRFVNLLAREAAKKHPDKIVVAIAYCGCRRAPLLVKPESNVQFVYCPYPPVWNCWLHADCPKNRRGREEFARWLQQQPGRIGIFDYPTGWKSPTGGFYAMTRKIQTYEDFGITQISFCGQDAFLEEFDYVAGRLLWNERTDIEGDIDAFMKFRYGAEAADPMRKYFNLVQERERALSLHRYDQPASMVDEQFFRTGLALLNEAAEKTLPEGLLGIDRQRMYLLQDYLRQHNKTSGLKGAALEEYAVNLAEMLKLFQKFKRTSAEYRVTVRDLLVRDAQIDIGATNPWYNSPVIQEFWQNPVAMMLRKIASYEERDGELVFNLERFAGGENTKSYQYEGLPKSVRPFSKVLRRVSSPYSKINTGFELVAIPEKDGVLYLEGLDDEKEGVASVRVSINGKVVYEGVNGYAGEDWSVREIPVPAGLFVAGENTLLIENITPDKIPLPTFEEAEAPQQDYNWGWMMISNCRLKLAQ